MPDTGMQAIPDEAVAAARKRGQGVIGDPFMARIRDFTTAEIEEGRLAAADAEADQANDAEWRKVLEAAAPALFRSFAESKVEAVADLVRNGRPHDGSDHDLAVDEDVRRALGLDGSSTGRGAD